MMLERGQRLRDHGVGAPGKSDDCAEVVLKLRMARLDRVGTRIDRDRLTRAGQIPAGQIEEVDRLFQDPVADAFDVKPPAARAEAIGTPPQLDQGIAWLANLACLDHLTNTPP